ncbi:hypothetical protein H0H92_011062 [Tricholoma furcatifolium]|nr:hypothetical protein H0H92_011062 [Tricholoma furcatifolium]
MPAERRKAARSHSNSRQRRCHVGADYNAFGFDPYGRIAYIAAELYGSDYVPSNTVRRFIGDVQPPRYGPPAPYQRHVLPPGWTPKPSPYCSMWGTPPPNDHDFHGPFPEKFNPHIVQALLLSSRFGRDKVWVSEQPRLKNCVIELEEELDREIAKDIEAGLVPSFSPKLEPISEDVKPNRAQGEVADQMEQIKIEADILAQT